MPEFVRKAIQAQGRIAPEEVAERMDELEDDALLGVAYPEEEPAPEPTQETLDIGSVPPADAP